MWLRKLLSSNEDKKECFEKDTKMNDLLISMLVNYGLAEVPGIKSNPVILDMFKELNYTISDDSTTAWCSAALSYFAKSCGYEYHKDLDARGWLKMPIMVLQPEIGDVVILWRTSPSSWQGHVGLFITQDNNTVWILGGNQNNQINISPYPRDRVLGYRRLRKLTDIT